MRVLRMEDGVERVPEALGGGRLPRRRPLPEEVGKLLGRVGMSTGRARPSTAPSSTVRLVRSKCSAMKDANRAAGIIPSSTDLALRQRNSSAALKIRSITWRLLPRYT